MRRGNVVSAAVGIARRSNEVRYGILRSCVYACVRGADRHRRRRRCRQSTCLASVPQGLCFSAQTGATAPSSCTDDQQAPPSWRRRQSPERERGLRLGQKRALYRRRWTMQNVRRGTRWRHHTAAGATHCGINPPGLASCRQERG